MLTSDNLLELYAYFETEVTVLQRDGGSAYLISKAERLRDMTLEALHASWDAERGKSTII